MCYGARRPDDPPHLSDTERKGHSMQIRVAEQRDADALAHVVVTAYRDAHRDYLPPDYLLSSLSYEQSARNWGRKLCDIGLDATTRERVFAAEDSDGRIVGVAMGGPDRAGTAVEDDPGTVGELYILYILPGYQRRGIGRLLIAAVARWLVRHGMHGMRVRVLGTNMPARRFYAALGGEEIGEEEDEDEGIVLHQVVYEWTNLRHRWPGSAG